MNSKTNNYKNIPLGSIFKKLEQGGFKLSIKSILEIESIVLSKNASNANWKIKELKYIIAPLIAKNKQEQNAVYNIVDDELNNLFFEAAIYKKPDSIDLLPKRVSKFFKTVLGKYILVVTLFLITIISIVLISPKKITKAKVAVVKNSDSSNATNEFFTVDTASEKSKIPKTSISSNSLEIITNKGFQVITNNPITPIVPNVILPITAIFGILIGIILHFFVFYEKKNIAVLQNEDADVEKKNQLDNFINDNRKPDNNIFSNKLFKKLEYINTPYKTNHEPLHLFEFSEKLKALSQTQFSNTTEQRIDISKTIKKTIKQAGYPSFAYSDVASTNAYLILIDINNSNHHLLNLVYSIVDIISRYFKIEIYTYKKILQTVRELKSGNTFTIDQLYNEKGKFNLMIFGEDYLLYGHIHLNETKRVGATLNVRLIKSLSQFKSVSFFNTSSDTYIYNYEKELLNDNIVLSNLKLLEILKNFNNTPKNHRKRITQLSQNTDSDYHFIDTIGYIKNSLNNDLLFQVLCSLAIYPKLDYYITHKLFVNILSSYGYFKNNDHSTEYELLLQLLQIDLFNNKKFDENLRTELLRYLQPEVETIVRKSLGEMLDIIHKSDSETLEYSREIIDDIEINKSFLKILENTNYLKNEENVKVLNAKLEKQNEQALVKQLQHKINANKTVVRKTIAVDVLKISLARASILLIPPILIYLALTKFKPHQVFPAGENYYEKSSIVLDFDNVRCSDVKTVKIHWDKFDKTDINLSKEKQYQFERQCGDSIVVSYLASNNKKEYQTKIGCTFKNYYIKITECK